MEVTLSVSASTTSFSTLFAKFLESIRPDYVVNLSGISYVSYRDYRQIYDVNFNGAVNVLKACEEYVPNCKLLLVSSGQIYASSIDAINESYELKLSNHYDPLCLGQRHI